MVAVDDDTGDNGRMTFGWDVSHRHEQVPFRITPTTGCVWLTGLLDYETRTTYNLSVEVSDSGRPQFSSICTLLVHVHDVNENMYAPQFDTFAKEMKVYGRHGGPN
jgi:protocadherin Fat 1/2/3